MFSSITNCFLGPLCSKPFKLDKIYQGRTVMGIHTKIFALGSYKVLKWKALPITYLRDKLNCILSMPIPINLSKWKPTRASQAASCKIDFGSTLSFCAEALNSQIYDRRACASAQLLTPLGTQWSCYSYGRFCSGKTITRAFEKLHWQKKGTAFSTACLIFEAYIGGEYITFYNYK